MTVENNPFSFVQMTDGSINPVTSCSGTDFPVVSGTDTIFQFVMNAADATELAYLTTNHPIRLYYNGAMHNTTVNWAFKDLGNNRVLIYIPNTGVPEIDALPVGQCFRFVYVYTAFTAIAPYSQCFAKVANDNNTTLLEYSNTVDQNGFYYCDLPSYVNKIRLRFQIVDVTFEGVYNIYRYSNGKIFNPSSTINKLLHFQTDWMEYNVLDALQVALNSRLVKITSDLYTGEIVSASVIEPEFNTESLSMRTTPRATFAAYQTPYNVQLNSCTACN